MTTSRSKPMTATYRLDAATTRRLERLRAKRGRTRLRSRTAVIEEAVALLYATEFGSEAP